MISKKILLLSLLFVLLFFSQCKKDEKIVEESELDNESSTVQPEQNSSNEVLLENKIASTSENKVEENSVSSDNKKDKYAEIKANFNNENYKKSKKVRKNKTTESIKPIDANINEIESQNSIQQKIQLEQKNQTTDLEKVRLAEVEKQNEELKQQEELEAAKLKAEEEKAIANKVRAEQEIQEKKDSLKALAAADSIKKVMWNSRTRHYFGVTLNQGFVLNNNHPNLPDGFGGTLRYATTDKLFKSKKNLLTVSLSGFNNPYEGGSGIFKTLFNGKNDALNYISLMFGYRINFKDFESGLFFEPSIGPVASGGDYFGGMFTGKLGYLFNKWEVATFIDLATGSENNNLGKKEIITTGISAGYNFDLTKPRK